MIFPLISFKKTYNHLLLQLLILNNTIIYFNSFIIKFTYLSK